MQDPTREEMIEFLQAFPFISECDDFDIEEAIYWFAHSWHGGQASNLYEALSTSDYTPSPIASYIPKEGMSYSLLCELERHYK